MTITEHGGPVRRVPVLEVAGPVAGAGACVQLAGDATVLVFRVAGWIPAATVGRHEPLPAAVAPGAQISGWVAFALPRQADQAAVAIAEQTPAGGGATAVSLNPPAPPTS